MIEREIYEIEKFLGDRKSSQEATRIRNEYKLYFNTIRNKWEADYETVYEILCRKYQAANKYQSYYNILLCMKLWGGGHG